MTAQPLAHDFPQRSVMALRHPHQVAIEEHLTELEEELARRDRVYPGLVRQGTMTQADADRHNEIWRAMIEDHRHNANAIAALLGRPAPHDAAPYTLDWPARIRELRRELAMRRNAYPKWIASPTNPLTKEAARRKLERLDAIHDHYWNHLFAFDGADPSRDGDYDHTDYARFAWIAEAAIARKAEGWDFAIPERGPAADAALRERVQWHALLRLARHLEGGGTVARFALPEEMQLLADLVDREYDAELAASWQDRTRPCVVGQIRNLSNWLGRYRARPAAPIDTAKEAA